MNKSLAEDTDDETLHFSLTLLQSYAFLAWIGAAICVGYFVVVTYNCCRLYTVALVPWGLDIITSFLGFIWLEICVWQYQMNPKIRGQYWMCVQLQGSLDLPFYFGSFFLGLVSIFRWIFVKCKGKILPHTISSMIVTSLYFMAICYTTFIMMLFNDDHKYIGLTDQVCQKPSNDLRRPPQILIFMAYGLANMIFSIGSVIMNILTEMPDGVEIKIPAPSDTSEPQVDPSYMHEAAAELLNEPNIEHNSGTWRIRWSTPVMVCIILNFTNLLIPSIIYLIQFTGVTLSTQQFFMSMNTLITNLIRIPMIYHGLIQNNFVPANPTSSSKSYPAMVDFQVESRHENEDPPSHESRLEA